MPRGLMWLTVVLTAISVQSAYADTVDGFSLPTRRLDAQAVGAQAARVAAIVAHDVAPDATPAPAHTVDLSARVVHARSAFVAGQLDAAALELDTVIEEGLQQVSALHDPQDLLQALVTRASIGLARNEGERVGEVLDRALRFEPSLELAPAERSPALRAALERAHQRVGAHPELHSSDLGKACESVRILIVARVLDDHTIELSRFDRCRFVAAALLGGGIDEQGAASSLAHASAGPTIAVQSPNAPHATHRAWIFGIVGGVGLALAATGAGLVGSTVPEYNRLSTMCGAGTCAPSLARPYEQRADAGWALAALGAATGVAALIAGLVVRHRDRAGR